MAIERDIHDLLYDHDCVIVPRFGGFLTHYRGAWLDEQRALVHPPGKDVSFNRHLVRNDGLLNDRVAKHENVGFKQANAFVDGEVDAWNGELERKGRLELPRIGTFYRDVERNLQFEPDRHANYLKDAFGLRSIAAVPIATAAGKPAPKVLPLPSSVPMMSEKEPLRISPLLAAAAIAAIFFTAGTWWVVSRDSPSGAQWSGFDVFRADEPTKYTTRNPATEQPTITDTMPWRPAPELAGVVRQPIAGEQGPLVAVDFGAAPVKRDTAITAPAAQQETLKAVPESTRVETPAPRRRFHVIGGCFLMKDNADGFVADLRAKGFDATIIDQKGGLYRVAYGSYPERALAVEALNAVHKEEAPAAWLLVK